MSKKRLYIIIAITAIITIGFFLAAYILSRDTGAPSGDNTNPFANFFPFGKNTTQTPGGGTDSTPDTNPLVDGTGNNPDETQVNPKNLLALRKISATATAGYSPSLVLGKTAVQFTERSSGNIFETSLENMRRDRISNALLPKVQEAFFGNDGKHLVYRYLKDGASIIVTFIRNVPNPDRSNVAAVGATSTNPITGSFLPEDIMNVIVSADSKNMFYLTKTPDFNTHVALGNVFNFQKNTSTRVFQSPFTEWLPVAFDGKTVILQTKASQNVPGYLYSMSTSNGELQKIIGGVNGLTALPSPNLQKILYSESTRGGVALHLYDRKGKNTINIQLSTLPEKCAWNTDGTVIYCAAPDYIPSATYPDAWYQGTVSFSDAMWKIDPTTGNITTVFVPGTFNAPQMDMENLTVSSNKDFLFFINKNDSTLWGYDLR